MWFRRNRPPRDPKALGRWGEKQAQAFLETQGLVCVERNFTCQSGEIDLIMTDSDKTLVFVEVKTRTSEDHHAVESAITFAKKRRMTRAAGFYVGIHDLAHRPLRFDVITISASVPGDLRHYPNAWVP
ncbi:MAG: YraN family protein [Phycisphaerae bacterium]|nr:YraN family protein [Phycisphaerae bacterium]